MPVKRPTVGDLVEFDCEGGVGFGHATHREASKGMRGMWVVALLAGVHPAGAAPRLGREICRIWLPLGAAISQGFMRIVGNQTPASDEMPPSIMAVSFDFVRASVVHGRSLHDEDFLDSLFEQDS